MLTIASIGDADAAFEVVLVALLPLFFSRIAQPGGHDDGTRHRVGIEVRRGIHHRLIDRRDAAATPESRRRSPAGGALVIAFLRLSFSAATELFRGFEYPGLSSGVSLAVSLVAVAPVITGTKTRPPHRLAGVHCVAQEGDGIMIMAVIHEDLQKLARRVCVAEQRLAFAQQLKVLCDFLSVRPSS